MSLLPELEHHYGSHVHIVDDPVAHTLLGRLCAPQTVQPAISHLVQSLYRHLIWVAMSNAAPAVASEYPTRMLAHEPRAIWRGLTTDPQARAVVVCVARAGIFPSQVCFDFLNELMNPALVRQDHLLMNRTTNEQGQVQGASVFGAKIGGDIDRAMLVVPDPMGATGSTLKSLLDHYQREVSGTPTKVIALHLIVTPEYLRAIAELPIVPEVYALRLDRGLSTDEVLDTTPGLRWSEERGLNDQQYIVPGGGGLGEVINNAER
jgi:uracil phosphoribosyltransferase